MSELAANLHNVVAQLVLRVCAFSLFNVRAL